MIEANIPMQEVFKGDDDVEVLLEKGKGKLSKGQDQKDEEIYEQEKDEQRSSEDKGKSRKRNLELSATKERSIRSERVEIFVQVADARLQKSLEQLLEDASGEIGLTSNWKLVSEAVNVIVKRQMRVDKLIVIDSSETSDEEVKDKSGTIKHKLEDPILNDVVKVDSLSVYAYIAKSKANEAWVEEKRKRDEEAAGTSKRATRSSTKKEEVPKPSPEVNMEDAPKDKKQGKLRSASYKSKSDIELATNLKKVFEERILNSKMEMTLGDILGIAKRDFHEEIIDIIKRKQ
ncbi:hypothetical protein L7F22_003972 [Adiantum nelumboides]|nr:hypothetical protein [Adiantum nelumboides]